MAAGVAHAAAKGLPVRGRLVAGAGSNLLRALALATLYRDAPARGRRVMIGGSLAGAALAASLAQAVYPRRNE